MAIFKIGEVDFSEHLIAGAYSINSVEKVYAWTDGDGRTHKRTLRSQLTGTVDLFFKTMDEYMAFIEAIDASKAENRANYVTATLTDNMTNQDKPGLYYLTFAPVRNRDVNWRDCIERFTVTVEEY